MKQFFTRITSKNLGVKKVFSMSISFHNLICRIEVMVIHNDGILNILRHI